MKRGGKCVGVVVLLAALIALLWLWQRPSAVVVRPGELERSYWVWHRTSPLTDGEEETLRKQKVQRLFWRAGEVRLGKDGRLEMSARLPDIDGLSMEMEIVPVVRLADGGDWPERGDEAGEMADLLRSCMGNRTREVQLDYDCPARLLGEYAAYLGLLRVLLGDDVRLSVTMLASHGGRNEIKALAKVVYAFYPMFYDLRVDGAEAVRDGRLLPMASQEDMQRWIAPWRRCGRPWYAGVPAFSRLTAYDASGELVGHWRDWSLDDLWRQAKRGGWQVARPRDGLLVLTVPESGRVARVGKHVVKPGWRMVLRWAEPRQIAAMVEEADRAGARGVVAFRLPNVGRSNLQSLEEVGRGLARTGEGEAALAVAITDEGEVVLENRGGKDLLPDWANGREYELELHVPQAAEVRDAGEFLSYKRRRKSLVFRFVKLRVGDSLVTGHIDALRETSDWKWRLDDNAWQSFAE